MSRNGAGRIGISYMKRGTQTIRSLEDYKLFIATKSNGLTKTGQLLFQQSVESYVYCVLVLKQAPDGRSLEEVRCRYRPKKFLRN